MNKFKALLITGVLISGQINASGIPTVDAAAMAQEATQFAQELQAYADQLATTREHLENAKEQLENAKEQLEAQIGYTVDFAETLIDESVSEYLPDDWSEYNSGTANAENLAKANGLESDSEYAQAVYNQTASNILILDKMYQSNLKRKENIANLQRKMNEATTPAEKADLANAMHLEKLKMEIEQEQAKTLYELNMQQNRVIEQKLAKLKKDCLWQEISGVDKSSCM